MAMVSEDSSALQSPARSLKATSLVESRRRMLQCYSATPNSLWRRSDPVQGLQKLRTHWYLFSQLVRREILSRYQGSRLGLAWASLQPLLLLLVYFFVFRFVFRARLAGSGAESHLEFCLNLVAGLMVLTLGSEVLQRSPALIHAHPNLVKRVRFPLELLCPVALTSSCFHVLLALVLVTTVNACYAGNVTWHACWLPLVLLPYLAFLLGCSWTLAAVGTFVRDLNQIVALGCQVLVFLTPVFYRLTDVPERLQPFIAWSPFAIAVENVRRVLLWGQPPDAGSLLFLGTVGSVVMLVGFKLFLRAKRAFADVM